MLSVTLEGLLSLFVCMSEETEDTVAELVSKRFFFLLLFHNSLSQTMMFKSTGLE